MDKSIVIWLTGLSASGKTTIGDALTKNLKTLGHRVEHLDGDLVRKMFPGTGFTREERDRHIKRVGYLAAMLEKHGVIVVASFISPYREARAGEITNFTGIDDPYESPEILKSRSTLPVYLLKTQSTRS